MKKLRLRMPNDHDQMYNAPKWQSQHVTQVQQRLVPPEGPTDGTLVVSLREFGDIGQHC